VFFQRTSYFVGLFLFEILKIFTGHQLGLRIYMSLFPLVVMAIGAFAFMRLYKISQEELEQNIKELEKLNL
ncbi:MAG: hypothetical protein P8Y23_05950, partial [Candidatus Lokiarchaeota archaeon]